MILIEHGNMWFIGSGYLSEAEHIVKCTIQSICIGSVNAFVLISGWFGIRSNVNKVGSLVFMIFFCTLPILGAALLFQWIPITMLSTIGGVYDYVFGGNNYWFVVDYIGLLIIAPILNKGIDAMDRMRFSRLLIYAYALILIYDFVLRTPVLGTEGGYSLIWFSFLYILARYMRIYSVRFVEKSCWFLIIIAISMQSVLFFYGLIGLRYTNPLILLEAVCLIYIFQKWNFHNRLINYAASAALMAYLLHMQPVLVPSISKYLAIQYSQHGYWLYIAEVILFAFGVFLLAIPLNRIQSGIYSRLKLCLSR